jgi:hypothetical protein
MNAKRLVIVAIVAGAALIGINGGYDDGTFGATHTVAGGYDDGTFGAVRPVADSGDYYQPVY